MSGQPFSGHLVLVKRYMRPSGNLRRYIQPLVIYRHRCFSGKNTRTPNIPQVGRFILKINSDGPVCASLTGGVAHGSPSGQMVIADDDLRWGEDYTIASGSRGGVGPPPLNSVECGRILSSIL